MRRREFVAGLAGVAAWPLGTWAQPTAKPVIGFLVSQSPDLFASHLQAFHAGLRENGYIEGQNVAVEYRWARGEYNRLAALAITRNVSVIAAIGPPAALAVKAASSTIPFIFTSGADVVKSGLVNSLGRPGGNATGINLFTKAVEPKKFELLDRLITGSSSIAFLFNPDNPAAEGKAMEMQEAARDSGRQFHILSA